MSRLKLSSVHDRLWSIGFDIHDQCLSSCFCLLKRVKSFPLLIFVGGYQILFSQKKYDTIYKSLPLVAQIRPRGSCFIEFIEQVRERDKNLLNLLYRDKNNRFYLSYDFNSFAAKFPGKCTSQCQIYFG